MASCRLKLVDMKKESYMKCFGSVSIVGCGDFLQAHLPVNQREAKLIITPSASPPYQKTRLGFLTHSPQNKLTLQHNKYPFHSEVITAAGRSS